LENTGGCSEKASSLNKIPKRVQVTEDVLRGITDCIVETFHPEKVILFGSYAYGNPTPDSDVDLLVIMESRKRSAERIAEISLRCRPPFVPLEIVALTPGEIRRRLADYDPFLEEVLEKGRVLYEAKRKDEARWL
jgi:predicted nucleotidyltransferase